MIDWNSLCILEVRKENIMALAKRELIPPLGSFRKEMEGLFDEFNRRKVAGDF
ncbi:MAG: hypothetical protein ACRD1X_16270 [Vicinamibacteria bacterium]